MNLKIKPLFVLCGVIFSGFEFKLIYFVLIQSVSIGFCVSTFNSDIIFKNLKFVILVLTFLNIIFRFNKFHVSNSFSVFIAQFRCFARLFTFHFIIPKLCSTFSVSAYHFTIVLKSFRSAEFFTFQLFIFRIIAQI